VFEGKLIAFVGVVIAPCLIAVSLWYPIHSAIGGEPIEAADYLWAALYGGLSLIIMLFGFSVLRDLKKAAAANRWARAAALALPVVWLLSFGAGCLFGRWVAADKIRLRAELDRYECQRLFGDERPLEACVALVRDCRHGKLDLAEVTFPGGMPPPGLWPAELDIPPSPKERAVTLCVLRRRGEIGL